MTTVRDRTAHGQAPELTSRTMPIASGVMDSTYRGTSRLSSGSEPVARGPAQGRIAGSLRRLVDQAHCWMIVWRFFVVKEHPILFSGEMIRAILEGRKTQTRRVMRPQPYVDFVTDEGVHMWQYPGKNACAFLEWQGIADWVLADCPYGAPGDLLWVRETWATVNAYDDLKPSAIPKGNAGRWPRIWYRATDAHEQEYRQTYFGKWRPSIFMPRWASRITLEVVSVRVEWVQDISESDAEAEGVTPKGYVASRPITLVGDKLEHTAYRDTFHTLWDSINAKRSYPWADNPWVWVPTFKVQEITR